MIMKETKTQNHCKTSWNYTSCSIRFNLQESICWLSGYLGICMKKSCWNYSIYRNIRKKLYTTLLNWTVMGGELWKTIQRKRNISFSNCKVKMGCSFFNKAWTVEIYKKKMCYYFFKLNGSRGVNCWKL